MQIPQWNQRNAFLHIPKSGCHCLYDTHQAHDSRPRHMTDRSTPTVTMLYSYTVTTSSPLWGFYFWHFKCWICCLVFKNPNQNVRTRGQSRTTAQGLQWGCQVHTGLTEPSGWLGSLSASDQKKRCRTKAHWPLLTVFTSWCYQITSQHEEPNLENANWERI